MDTSSPKGQRNLQSAPGVDRASIQGWGADLDPKDRPAVPMERTPPRLPGANMRPLEQQRPDVEIFHSPERPDITPIFGTSTPPKGLSGAIRRVAYKLTENDIRHWLLLMLADRVNVVEGIGQDLSHGKVPNVLAEMGIRAEWRYNRAGLVRKAVAATTAFGVAWYLIKRRNDNR